MNNFTIHDSAIAYTKNIGEGTRIWQFAVILDGAQIGRDCNICSHCFIESDVLIGDRVTIKNGVQIWDGLRVSDDVFIGPNVSFTNDRFPRSKQYPEKYLLTTINSGASIGAGAVILPGIEIGSKAMVAAGAVVTKSIPPNSIVVGNPAKIIGYVDATKIDSTNIFQDKNKIGQQSTSVNGVILTRFPRIPDIRGSLSFGEFERNIPFLPKRYFIVYDVPSLETRGEHAHKKCHQFLICIRGSCSVVADDGVNRQEFLLDKPDIGLYLPPLVWGIQYNYSSDAVLLVFTSDFYDSSDYIRDYSEFKKIAGH